MSEPRQVCIRQTEYAIVPWQAAQVTHDDVGLGGESSLPDADGSCASCGSSRGAVFEEAVRTGERPSIRRKVDKASP